MRDVRMLVSSRACADAGVEPLPEDDLAVLANAILTGNCRRSRRCIDALAVA